MSIKSISIVFVICILILITALIALDSYSLKSIVNDSPNISATRPASIDKSSPIESYDSVPNKNQAITLEDVNTEEIKTKSKQNNLDHLGLTSTNTNTHPSDRRKQETITNTRENSFESDNQANIKQAENSAIINAGNISGRVFTSGGKTIANIEVTASPYDISPGQSNKANNTLRTKTNELGHYFFNSVPKASYRICSTKSEYYSQSCINVLPPQRTADLKIIPLSNLIRVSGLVSDEAGEPLSNVNVRVNAQGSKSVKTKSDGSYQIEFRTSETINRNIVFTLKGYLNESKQIPIDEEKSLLNITINANLSLKKEGFVVQGKMTDTQGEPAPGQRIRLRSASDRNKFTNYVTSNAQGLFTINRVEAADDYQINIFTSADYKYLKPETQQEIIVSDNSTNLSVEFEKIYFDYQPMRIFLATKDQQAISDVKLNLSFKGKIISQAVTDASGSALFEKVPNGNLSISVISLGLRVTGLTREQHDGITLFADKGSNEVRITVLGSNGQAVFCRRANISVNQRQNNLSVSTSRNVQSDQSGIIYATDFSSGQHQLSLTQCDGHKNYNGTINIGNQIDFSINLTSSK